MFLTQLEEQTYFSIPNEDAIVRNSCELFNLRNEYGLDNIEFTISEVEAVFKSFKSYSAPGPDDFPSILLKECASELAPVFHNLFQRSVSSGIVPNDLKIAKITPLHKGGSKQLAENYRPVALTSHIAKALEKLVRQSIVNHLDQNDILSNSQHGFRSGHSTVSQLLSHMEAVVDGLDSDSCVDVIYLDFSKAFDKVDIGLLLRKCESVGILHSPM